MRTELRRVFDSDPAITLAGEAEGGIEAVEAARELKPDVIILDIGLRKLNGIEVAAWIRRFGLKSAILMLSIHSDSRYVRRAINAGAQGYLVKGFVGPDEILRAVHAVSSGGNYFSPLVAEEGLRAARAEG
jgi:DNA-binding NarL/FixJ family response regulator